MKVPRHEKLKPRRTKFVVDFLSFVKTRDQVKNGSPEMQHFVSQDGTGREEPILEIILRGHISSLVNSKVPCWPTTDTHPWVLHCYIGIQVLGWIVTIRLWNLKTRMNMECHNWRKPLWYGDHRQWVGGVCDKHHTWWDDHKNISDWQPQ